MSYFIYTDLIDSLLDPRLVDPGSALIHVGAYVEVVDPGSTWTTLVHTALRVKPNINKSKNYLIFLQIYCFSFLRTLIKLLPCEYCQSKLSF